MWKILTCADVIPTRFWTRRLSWDGLLLSMSVSQLFLLYKFASWRILLMLTFQHSIRYIRFIPWCWIPGTEVVIWLLELDFLFQSFFLFSVLIVSFQYSHSVWQADWTSTIHINEVHVKQPLLRFNRSLNLFRRGHVVIWYLFICSFSIGHTHIIHSDML